MIEVKYIKTMKCIDKNIPIRANKEYREDKQEKIQQYRQDNNENIKRKH